MPPIIEKLTKAHDRSNFSCGNDSLDRYLKTQARQEMERNVAQIFVMVDDDHKTIKGYYSLSSGSLELSGMPENLRRTLPRYPKVPVILLGRLAVDVRFKGQGIGKILLIDALFRALRQSSEVASAAVVVDAIDDTAVAFYKHFRFISLSDTTRTLFIEMTEIKRLTTA